MAEASYQEKIRKSGLTIYDPIIHDHKGLWIPNISLEKILRTGLTGLEYSGLPLRTRSKVIKSEICKILGYPIPTTFQKTQPRFPGQDFDVYVQKSNNLQIWNEELCSSRRYVLIRLSENDIITGVCVLSGIQLAALDKTGTLTQKYQARLPLNKGTGVLFSESDTSNLIPLVSQSGTLNVKNSSPIDLPSRGKLASIKTLFNSLKALIGLTFDDVGSDQERNRGALLHKIICKTLGYKVYRDDGQFPDIKNQLLEIKLQTSPTIDLGLISPDNPSALDMPTIEGVTIRHCDVRYLLIYAEIINSKVNICNYFLITGEMFFTKFAQFKGRVINTKRQIPIQDSLFL